MLRRILTKEQSRAQLRENIETLFSTSRDSNEKDDEIEDEEDDRELTDVEEDGDDNL